MEISLKAVCVILFYFLTLKKNVQIKQNCLTVSLYTVFLLSSYLLKMFSKSEMELLYHLCSSK